MKKLLFWTSIICSALVCIFLWTNISLNGYKTDFYFFLFTVFLNLVSFVALRKIPITRQKSFINLFLLTLQIIGLFIFLFTDTIQVNKVYTPSDNEYNVYASLTGFYKRQYFKKSKTRNCNDGMLWHTKVPYYFPLIEIETARKKCFKIPKDVFAVEIKYIPE